MESNGITENRFVFLIYLKPCKINARRVTIVIFRMKKENYPRVSLFVLLVVYAVAMAVATFVENSQGTPVARRWFYGAPWFLLVEFLLAVNFIWLVVRQKMFTRRQWGSLLFHSAFVVILAGAGITHFFSDEGVMHIREGEQVNYMLTDGGMQRQELPFEAYLKDFRLERYPGSHKRCHSNGGRGETRAHDLYEQCGGCERLSLVSGLLRPGRAGDGVVGEL